MLVTVSHAKPELFRKSANQFPIPADGGNYNESDTRGPVLGHSNGWPPLYSGVPVSTPVKFLSGSPMLSLPLRDGHLADGALVWSRAALHHRERLAHFASGLEIAKKKHIVGEIADIGRRRDCGSDQAILRQHQDGGNADLIQIGEDLVKLHGQRLLFAHGDSSIRSDCQ